MSRYLPPHVGDESCEKTCFLHYKSENRVIPYSGGKEAPPDIEGYKKCLAECPTKVGGHMRKVTYAKTDQTHTCKDGVTRRLYVKDGKPYVRRLNKTSNKMRYVRV